jgi:hypothetical protein
MLLYVYIIENIKAKANFTLFGQAYCQIRQLGDPKAGSSLSVILTRDLMFVVPMMWTSIYMVCLLYRHHRTAQHVHSSSLSSQTSPENKVTPQHPLLVSCFVFFYWSKNFVTLMGFLDLRKFQDWTWLLEFYHHDTQPSAHFCWWRIIKLSPYLLLSFQCWDLFTLQVHSVGDLTPHNFLATEESLR